MLRQGRHGAAAPFRGGDTRERTEQAARPVPPHALLATTPSQPAPASVLAEVTRQLFGRCSPVQLLDMLGFEDRLAIDGILKPFELGLEMIDPLFESPHSMLPTGVTRSKA